MEPGVSKLVAQNHNVGSNAGPIQLSSHPPILFFSDSLQYVFTSVMFKSHAFYFLIYKQVLMIYSLDTGSVVK
jgi:hypothetical protein